MTYAPLLPFAFGGVFPLHAGGTVRAVFRPVGAGKEKPGADGTPFPFQPVEKGRFQFPVKGKDGTAEPPA